MNDPLKRLPGLALMLLCTAASVGTLCPSSTIRPGDDFYSYANQKWVAETRLPDGASKIDTTSVLRLENQRRVQNIVGEAVHAAAGHGIMRPDARKMANYYSSQNDTLAIESRGFRPLAADLAAIAAIDDRNTLADWLGRTVRLDDGSNQQTESLWGVWIHQNFHDPDRYAAHLVQGGLGLPGKEDYSDGGEAAVARRAQYQGHITEVLRAAGIDSPEARAKRIIALETAIAATHAPRSDTDNVFKTDNDWNAADFATKAPGMDWPRFFKAAKLDPTTRFVVWQPSSVVGSARLIATLPLEAWKDYLTYHLIAHYAQVLPRVVSGDSNPPFDAMTATQSVFGDTIGRLYTERYFPSSAKRAAQAMAENIRRSFRSRIGRLTWMSGPTKTAALEKLDALRIGVGYPDRWTDFTKLRIVQGDAFGNFRRAEEFAYVRQISKLGGPVDPGEWADQIHPQMVGAILNISPNSMQFAAGILQPPYFDPDGDLAANYGSAGAGMAHEVSHSFDEIGNLYDAGGRLGLWWSDEDVTRYHTVAAPLATQIDNCGPVPGLGIDGQKVLSESAADLAGLAAAYDAYHLALRGKPDAIKNGLTGDQRFFIAFAQRWRRNQTHEALLAQVQSDNHAIPECRSNLVRNSDAWVKAFGVQPGDQLYVGPTDRIRIW